MKRIPFDTFINGAWGEDAYVIRVTDGNIFMKAWVEEWPDAGLNLPPEDKEGVRIMESSLQNGIRLDISMIRLEMLFDAVTSSEDYRYPFNFRYEENSEHCSDRENFKTVYECLCSLAEPYKSNGMAGELDYEILQMTYLEFANLCDILRDGDYIIAFSEE